MEKENLFWKMYVYVTFPSHFSCTLLLIRDLAALLKSTFFDSLWFILIFYLKKKDTNRWSVIELFHIKNVFCKIILNKPR